MVFCLALTNLVVTGLVFYFWYEQTGPHDWHPCPKTCHCSYPWYIKGAFVNCSRRFLSSVPPDIPRETVQLDMSHNTVPMLPHFKLESLKILDMSHNPLGDRGSAGLKDRLGYSLEELGLAGVLITKIPMGLPPTLKNLDLCHNLIASISCTALSDLPQLHTLKLGRNMLSVIPKDSFCPRYGPPPKLASTLRHLDLSKNNMHNMHNGALDCLVVLEHLDLSCNLFTIVSVHTFRGIPSVQHLDLSMNRITQVADGAFIEMRGLISLNLANNRLTLAPRHLPSKLQLLDLSNNAIVTLYEDASLLRVNHIFVTHNPLLCDCNLGWIRSKLITAALPDNIKGKCTFPVWTPPNNDTALCDLMPRCAKPSAVAGKPLHTVPSDFFQCRDRTGEQIVPRNAPSQFQTKKSLPTPRHNARSANSLGNFFNNGLGRRGTDCECPKMPDEPWLWMYPLNDTSLKVEWQLPPALEDYSLEMMYYIFGHRGCKKILKVDVQQEQFILTHLRPDTNYIVCLVPRHCPEAEGGPVLLESCQEVRTLKAKLWDRIVLQLLGGTSCCHHNVAFVIMVLLLLGLLLMSGHVGRKLRCWWLEFSASSCNISSCSTKTLADTCIN